MSRRAALLGAATLGGFGTAAPRAADADPPYWPAWQAQLHAMEARAQGRGWDVTTLQIDPPADAAVLRAIEARYGLPFPSQLREVLSRCAATLAFGWTVPELHRPFASLDLPISGGIDGELWSTPQLNGRALDAFNDMRGKLEQAGDGEQPNPPALWQHQFPWMVLGNDDILTIDLSTPGAAPVRYFNGELEGLHGCALAPDFVSFMDRYIRLGCAGGDMDDWFRFIPPREDGVTAIDPESEGARRWLAWLHADPDRRGPDDPPSPVAARTQADFDLLAAAHDGSGWGVSVNLASGAQPDCVDARTPRPDGVSGVSFETALVYALRRDDLPAANQLLAAGARLDTRRLALTETLQHARTDTVRWVLGRGGRVNGWAGDSPAPLHALLVAYGDDAKLDERDRIALLKVLLGKGADADARWDGGRTMLMSTGPEAQTILLAHGADATLTDHDGNTALHIVRDPVSVPLLVNHGADPNALSRPPPLLGSPSADPPCTPVQAQLHGAQHAVVEALLRAGADLRRRDGWGRSSLWYCRTWADAERCIAQGCDPGERDRMGATLLHALVAGFGNGLATDAEAKTLFEALLRRGLDINAARQDGATPLHLMAARGGVEGVTLLLANGADRDRRDAKGHVPADLVRPDGDATRALLKG